MGQLTYRLELYDPIIDQRVIRLTNNYNNLPMPNKIGWVNCYDDDQLIASGLISHTNTMWYISYMYVHPDYRGKYDRLVRKTIASYIIDYITDHADPNHYMGFLRPRHRPPLGLYNSIIINGMKKKIVGNSISYTIRISKLRKILNTIPDRLRWQNISTI